MGSESTFSKREWLLTIALLMVVEAVILHLAYTFKEEESVINYISFAATVASLLLAVLAIIYGYVQNSTQQQAAAALSAQVGEMREVQAELNSASGSIGERATAISEVVSSLGKLSDTLSDARQGIEDLKGGISGLHEEQKAFQAAVASLQAKTKADPAVVAPVQGPVGMSMAEVIDRLFSKTSFEADLMSVALVDLYDKRGGVADEWTSFVTEHFAKPTAKAPGDTVQAFVEGGSILHTARAFGILKFEKTDGDLNYRFTVPPASIDALRACATRCRESSITSERAAAVDKTFG